MCRFQMCTCKSVPAPPPLFLFQKKLLLKTIADLTNILSVCSVPGTLLGGGDLMRNKIDMTLDLMELVGYPIKGEQIIVAQ